MRIAPSEMSDFESIIRKTGILKIIELNCYKYLIFFLGWGLYHKFLLGIACACAFSESGAFLTLPFALPVASCDLLISETYLKYFHISFMCGKLYL